MHGPKEDYNYLFRTMARTRQTTANLESDRRAQTKRSAKWKLDGHENNQCNCYCTQGSPWIERGWATVQQVTFCFSTGVHAFEDPRNGLLRSHTHGCAVLPSPLLQNENTRNFDRRNEQRDKHFRRHPDGNQVDQCWAWKFSLSHPGCSCREHKTTEC